MFELNYEQSSVVKLVKDGHNVLIMGQAGVGKTVYEPGVASTVNSRYGLQTSDLPWKQVVNRAAENSLVINNVRSVNVIIWDEAGMSSQRMFAP
jgi:flagellar biosynthesis GTPase FlhF